MTGSGKNIAVIGSGPMGLMCAYALLKKGHRIDLFERDDRIGGRSIWRRKSIELPQKRWIRDSPAKRLVQKSKYSGAISQE